MQKLFVRMTSKYQATIPKEVREVLHLKAKDQISYEINDDNTVTLHRARPSDIEYLAALRNTLNEWESSEDEKAYKDL